MISTWLFIILFNTTDAQVIKVQHQQDCVELKQYADNEIAKLKKSKEIFTACFRNVGNNTKES